MFKNNDSFKGQQRLIRVDIVLDSREKIESDDNQQTRKPYYKPQLEELGDLRALTFGSFPGILDSGGLGSFVPP